MIPRCACGAPFGLCRGETHWSGRAVDVPVAIAAPAPSLPKPRALALPASVRARFVQGVQPMPPIVTGVQPTMSAPGETGPPFTSEQRLYLTRDGKVVGEDDPDRHELLVAEGGQLPFARAEELGLVSGGEAGSAGAGDRAQTESLHRRIAELEARLADATSGGPPAPTGPPAAEVAAPRPQAEPPRPEAREAPQAGPRRAREESDEAPTKPRAR